MEKIKNVLSEIIQDKFYLEKDEIDWFQKLENVPLDDLVCEIELTYAIFIPIETSDSFKNLDDIVRYLDAQGVD